MSDQPSRRQFLASAVAGAPLSAILSAPATGKAVAADVPGRSASGSAAESSSVPRVSPPPTTFANINQASWETILADNRLEYRPPLTVHLPIQPLHSRDVLHVDPALNVCRRRIFPGVSSHNRDSYLAARKQEVFLVQLALDDPPFVPDFQLSRLSLAEGKYPLAHADYFAWDLFYEFDYFCCPVDQEQSVLWICGRVTNQGENAQQAHVRAKVGFHRECDIFDDTFDETYTPFYWDQTKWRPCAAVQLKDNSLWRDSTLIGKVAPNDWTVTWEGSFQSTDKQYNRKYGYDRPYYVPPVMRLKDIQNVVHLSAPLAPREKRSFALALLTNYEGPTPEHQRFLARAEPEKGRAAALARFRSELADNRTRLVFPTGDWDKIFTALQLSTLQMLIQFPGEKNLMPSPGESLSE